MRTRHSPARHVLFFVAVAAAVAAATAVPAPAPAAAAGLQLTPSADAYVYAVNPTSKYGTSAYLRIDGSPVMRSYLRFDLRSVSGTVSRAVLRVYANSASSSGYVVRTTDRADWSESSITYSTAPAVSTVVATSPAIVAGTVVSADVTAAVAAGGLVDLALEAGSATQVSLASRVCGIGPSGALTTRIAPSIWAAPVIMFLM